MTIEIPINSAYLFKGFLSGQYRLEEETYILEALNTSGIRVSPEESDDPSEYAFVSRWPDNKFPLNVFIEPDYGYLFTPQELKDFRQVVQSALSQIEKVNPPELGLVICEDIAVADIVIRCRKTETTIPSHCYPEIGREKQIKHAEMKINIAKNALTHQIYFEVLHNLLHALGVYGHSPHTGDFGSRVYQPTTLTLTLRDKNTLMLLYRCPLAVTKKELLLLWRDYQENYLSLPLNMVSPQVQMAFEDKDPFQHLHQGLLVKSQDLSLREIALKESFMRYLQTLQTA